MEEDERDVSICRDWDDLFCEARGRPFKRDDVVVLSGKEAWLARFCEEFEAGLWDSIDRKCPGFIENAFKPCVCCGTVLRTNIDACETTMDWQFPRLLEFPSKEYTEERRLKVEIEDGRSIDEIAEYLATALLPMLTACRSTLLAVSRATRRHGKTDLVLRCLTIEKTDRRSNDQ